MMDTLVSDLLDLAQDQVMRRFRKYERYLLLRRLILANTKRCNRAIFQFPLLGIFPCTSRLKGKKEVGKPKKYEFKEEKDKIAYF